MDKVWTGWTITGIGAGGGGDGTPLFFGLLRAHGILIGCAAQPKLVVSRFCETTLNGIGTKGWAALETCGKSPLAACQLLPQSTTVPSLRVPLFLAVPASNDWSRGCETTLVLQLAL